MKTIYAENTPVHPGGRIGTTPGARVWRQIPAAFLLFWIFNVTLFLYYAAKSGWTQLASWAPQ